MKIVKDWSDANTFFVYENDMTPRGYVHCFAATEWQAFDAEGVFIDWCPSKAAAVRKVAA